MNINTRGSSDEADSGLGATAVGLAFDWLCLLLDKRTHTHFVTKDCTIFIVQRGDTEWKWMWLDWIARCLCPNYGSIFSLASIGLWREYTGQAKSSPIGLPSNWWVATGEVGETIVLEEARTRVAWQLDPAIRHSPDHSNRLDHWRLIRSLEWKPNVSSGILAFEWAKDSNYFALVVCMFKLALLACHSNQNWKP